MCKLVGDQQVLEDVALLCDRVSEVQKRGEGLESWGKLAAPSLGDRRSGA